MERSPASTESTPTVTPKRWASLNAYAITLLVVALISFIRITPKVWPWTWQSKVPVAFEVIRVRPLLRQLADPIHWDVGESLTGGGVIDNAMRWRLLAPTVGRMLHLTPLAYLFLPWGGWLLLLGVTVYFSRYQLKLTCFQTGCLGVLVGTSVAAWLSMWTIGTFYAWWCGLLIVTIFTDSPAIAIGCCLLGPWIDERFVFILPVALVVRHHLKGIHAAWPGCLAALAPYLLIRLAALLNGDPSIGYQLTMQSAAFYGRALLPGWWHGFRAGWLLIAVALVAVSKNASPTGRWVLWVMLAGYVIVISFLSWDATQNTAAFAPLLLVGAGCLGAGSRWTLPVLTALNLVLPLAYWSGDLRVPITSFLCR